MENITYITGNYGKYIYVKEKFEKKDIEISYQNIDLEELNVNDIYQISKEKAKKAYEIVGSPVFVADTGFYIEEYPENPGYPGAFVKRSGVSSNIKQLLEDMKNIENRACYFEDCVTFYDGEEYYQFHGICKGTLSETIKGKDLAKAKSNLWYVFIPNNCIKTLAEMDDEERNNRKDERTSATDNFIDWYVNQYKKNKILVKSS